jgi:tetratricopeptide (TPR) repeat protein
LLSYNLLAKPDFHEAYYNMGGAYNKLKEYQKAIDACKEAIKIKPDFYEAYYNKGYKQAPYCNEFYNNQA